MRYDDYFDSCGKGKIHYCTWKPEGKPRGVVQIIHGMAEFVERYDGFARFLNEMGILVVAEDHMGHGKSVYDVPGYFYGGWFSVVEDCYYLLKLTKSKFPDVPYVLFGHSLGSFLTRSLLCRYPGAGISGAVLCGTGWQPRAALPLFRGICRAYCRRDGEKAPNPALEKLVFGAYNQKVEHPRTKFDWLSRDRAIVDSYIAHPLCGFVSTAGLMRDMMDGFIYNEDPKNLCRMEKTLPVLLISGGDDPVGDYGRGVQKTYQAFLKAGLTNVGIRIYPLCRHELLNEINREEIMKNLALWLEEILPKE